MARELHDHWFKEAKREGYRSRAIYKLREIDQKRKLLSPGDVVLDCGCAPGSWMQYVGERIGDRGVAIGVDLLDVTPLPGGNMHLLTGDLREVDDALILEHAGLDPTRRFDVVLSDMAPNTTGHRDTDHHRSMGLCDLVLQRTGPLLRSGGHLVMKAFEGTNFQDLVRRVHLCFDEVRTMRPVASRSVSREMFVVAMHRRDDAEITLPPPPSGGPPPVPEDWSVGR
ncbi:MAG: RlmE family RNA methyltransferase [Phycisphaerales bacterium]|nr:RlmE family RNA methyltransferase [Phycisphaerales bacterium]